MDFSDSFKRLTNRQKEILRLLFNGHDAKSAASELNISVHTVNEHLSETRKLLNISSSRKAARLFAEFEERPPKLEGPHNLGVAVSTDYTPSTASALARLHFVLGGAFVVVIFSIVAVGFLFVNTSVSTEASLVPPRVISTSPEDESRISPGPFNLIIRFDRPMMRDSYSVVKVSSETFPDCLPKAQLSADGKSYTMRCSAKAGREYEIWFNRPPYMNFKSREGISAQPHRIRFRAKSGS
jgi:DNA-binding CsgD family transcriptional regulator